MQVKMKKKALRIAWYVVVILISCISVIPLLIVVQIALSTPTQMAESSIWHIPAMEWENFKGAWENAGLGLAAVNSCVLTLGSIVLLIVTSSMAGFVIARRVSKFRNMLYNVFVFSMAIPTIISTVPLYLIMRWIGGVNTIWGMVLVCTSSSIPMAVFLYTGFVKAIPKEIEEAAMMDGCNFLQIFWKIVFPMLGPINATVIIMNALYFWNEYGRSVFFLQKKEVYTVPLAISEFMGKYSTNWAYMAGGATLAMIPAIIVFLFFQKQYVKGLQSGAVKG